MYAVITAGGKGTRIREIADQIPKPMIPILGKPILQYEVENLKKQGIEKIIITIGYLGFAIKEYFKDGKEFGVPISYIDESEPLGTAGALFYLKNIIKDDFLLVNGDLIFDIDLARFYKFHKKKGGIATLFTHPNSHPFDSGLIETDKTGKVLNWFHKEEKKIWYENQVNAGIHLLSPEIWVKWEEPKKRDLDRDVLKPFIKSGRLYAYRSPEYVKDMGTPKRCCQVETDIKNGLLKTKSLRRKQKAVFLDRDGTINHYFGFLTEINQFELKDGVCEAVRILNENGFLVIVVTNQPVIARGDITIDELEKIHHKMETLLGMGGAYVDGIYYCPHHPDSGFTGEISELKIDCGCRKPKPGMLIKAAEDFNILLEDSWMIGDSQIDIEAGKAAGCKTILLAHDESEYCKETKVCRELCEAVNYLLGENRLGR